MKKKSTLNVNDVPLILKQLTAMLIKLFKTYNGFILENDYRLINKIIEKVCTIATSEQKKELYKLLLSAQKHALGTTSAGCFVAFARYFGSLCPNEYRVVNAERERTYEEEQQSQSLGA